MATLPTATQEEIAGRAREIARAVIGPRAAQIDRDAAFPAEGLAALAEAGLFGLEVPPRLGGQGAGLLGLALVTQEIAAACASTAVCFAMHCVATAVIAAKATREQEEGILVPIAAGRHLTTLALSEAETGAEFYLPRTQLRRHGDSFLLDGSKDFVTSGGEADSYVVSASANGNGPPGEFSCLLIDGRLLRDAWGPAWTGIGLRGSSSRSLYLTNLEVPAGSLLGREGDEIWYVFEVVAPFFLVAIAGVSLGIAGAALEQTVAHLGTRRRAQDPATLARHPVLQQQVARAWLAVARSRCLLLDAAARADLNDPEAERLLMAAKVDAVETCVQVTNEALTLGGGLGYREDGVLGRLLRDARAGHVMSPTTTMLLGWIGRSVLGLPFL